MPLERNLHLRFLTDARGLDSSATPIAHSDQCRLHMPFKLCSDPIRPSLQDEAFRLARKAVVLRCENHLVLSTPDPDLPINHFDIPSDQILPRPEPAPDIATAVNTDTMRTFSPGESWSIAVQFDLKRFS